MNDLLRNLPELLDAYPIELNWDHDTGAADGEIELEHKQMAVRFNYVVTSKRLLTPAVFSFPYEASNYFADKYILDIRLFQNDFDITCTLSKEAFNELANTIHDNLNIKT